MNFMRVQSCRKKIKWFIAQPQSVIILEPVKYDKALVQSSYYNPYFY